MMKGIINRKKNKRKEKKTKKEIPQDKERGYLD